MKKSTRSTITGTFVMLLLLATTNALSSVPIRIETVDPALGVASSSTSIAVTPEGKPCIAYVKNGGTLVYAVYNHPTWSSEIISSGGGSFSNVSLSLDEQGNPVIAAGLFQNIFVYVKNGSAWDIVYTGEVGSWDPSVRHDSAGNLHVAFVNQYTGPWNIRYATNKTGSWVTEVVDYYADYQRSGVRQVALGLSQTGQPGIAWRDEDGHLQYSWKSSVWITQLVSNLNASHISLVVGIGSIPHIAYFDGDNADLIYSTGPVFSWSTTVINPTGRVGFDTAIALDSGDKPHISYFDDETAHISYHFLSGGVWYGQIVESPGAVGWRTSIALDAYDNVHFSYLDQGEHQLHYAVSQDCNGNGVDDLTDVSNETLADCDGNGIADGCEITMGFIDDCNDNEIPDDCDADCNNNNIPDDCDIEDETSLDCNGNGVPDECDPDCNDNDIPDECDIDAGNALDCNSNGIPDQCDFESGTSQDCNGNGIPDECDIRFGFSIDCNKNGIPDECDFASGDQVDCNANLEIDLCEFPDPVEMGGSEYGQFGSSVVSGDFNGDGYTDIAVGQPSWSGARGRVHVYYGGDPMDTVADEVFGPTTTHVYYGFALAAGNINGDAYDDLVVASPGYNLGNGVVFIFRGTPESDLTYMAAKGAPYNDMGFGTSVALADINGDGQEDVIVGAPERTTNNEPGYVFVYSGSNPDGDPIETWVANSNNDGFGASVGNAGDIDGNGLDDVIIGAVGGSSNGNLGYAKTFLSQPAGGSTPGPFLSSGVANDLFGHSVNGAGDLNDDGIDDYIVGVPRSGVPGDIPGRTFLYFGSESPDGIADLTFVGIEHLANLGSSVSVAGDLNADGFDDLIIGSDHQYSGDYSWADLFYGGPHLDPIPDKRFASDRNDYGMGKIVGPGGDTNGDGLIEVLVGNPNYSSGEFFAGRISIVQLSLPDDGDCNGNGTPDVCDISSGFSADINQDGVPDECSVISPVEDTDPRLLTRLLGAYPTPFNPRTELRFELAVGASVEMRVFDISGKLIRTLARGEVYGPGRHALTWQGLDDVGRQVASGVYFYRLDAGQYSQTKRVMLLK